MLSGARFAGIGELRLAGPQNDVVAVKAALEQGVPRFAYDHAEAPGLYTWRKTGSDEVVATTNVQLPATESDLFYSPAETLLEPADNVVVAHSIAELQGRFQRPQRTGAALDRADRRCPAASVRRSVRGECRQALEAAQAGRLSAEAVARGPP